MNSNPNGATSRWDSLIKPTRIVINLFLSQKMRSPPTVSDIGVMPSVHGDSICVTLPTGTLTVGFEQ